MRFNVKFTVEKDGETQTKFEVIETDTKYDKVNAKNLLNKKYPEHTVSVIKISQSVTAKAEIL